MDRREILKMIAMLTGVAVVGGEVFLSGCKNAPTAYAANWSETEIGLLDEVGETILPATASSPGAKAAGIGRFMNLMINDCYESYHQKAFIEGIKQIDEDCKKKSGKPFLTCSADERHNFLLTLEKEAKEYDHQREAKEKAAKEKNRNSEGLPFHYFTYIRQLTLFGFFTSKIGYTEALRYEAVPGRYDGDTPYIKGEKAWA
jgi:hypothetical protein